MKFSWRWLSDYVDLDGVAPESVAERLTLTVAELEGVERVGQGLGDVRVGRLVAVKQHPNADKLRVIEVDVGDRVVRGVSGAPNLEPGIVVPVALPGARLPGGVEVHAADLRGVASEVVALSERELALSDDHTGVMVLDPGATLGAALADVLPVEDTVFEVDNKSITHRPDLWGHLGLAREVAAMTGRPMRPLGTAIPPCDADPLRVFVDDAGDCPRYMAMCFTGVRIAPSPFWMRHRLRAVGLRPISNVVDLTNYLMCGLGNPLHAFDRRQLSGDTIRVRRAAAGEPFRTLDGTNLMLTAEDLLIADASRGVALAGVMGGENSEVLPDTADIVLEAATFHAGRIRRTAVRHGIRTDSSARFEKSLDPHLPPLAVAEFARLLAEVCPGSRASSRACDVSRLPSEPLRIALDPGYVSSRLGLDVPAERTRSALAGLGFGVADAADGKLDVTVPTWRATRDVSIPEDLVEEVGRVVGYDRIVPAPPLAPVVLVPRRPLDELARRIRATLAGACGMDEVQTYSFDSGALLRKLGFEPPAPLRLRNAISADLATLRTDLAPNLLGVIERNATRLAEFGAFELGRVFASARDAEGIPAQEHRLGMVFYDRAARAAPAAETLYRHSRGVLEHLLGRLDVSGVRVGGDWQGPRTPWMHPGATAAVAAGDSMLGYLVRVHPATLKALDQPGTAVLAELSLDAILSAPRQAPRFVTVPRFPSIQADISLLADDSLRSGDLAAVARREAGALCVAIDLVAIYSGPPIPEGRRSLTWRMTFQAPDRTLEDAEVQAAVTRVVAAAKGMGASRRE